jgi:nitroreductase
MNETLNETMKTMWERRSVRTYKPEPIPEEDLNLILEAARRAPTGGNRQKWRMVVIRDPRLRARTAEACSGQTWIAQAPVILCMVALPGEGKVNGAIVLDHAILAATSLGYGTCWIGAYDAHAVKTALKIPEGHTIVNLTPVGVPAESPDFRPHKSPDELFCDGKFSVPLSYDPETLPDAET